mmetsp:Transcript_74138/g.197694  ORF Transcript_74138/g.197694 Transcript_74138/m.197694 type:complete len:107 (-) Transcript_74138:487-807(-)
MEGAQSEGGQSSAPATLTAVKLSELSGGLSMATSLGPDLWLARGPGTEEPHAHIVFKCPTFQISATRAVWRSMLFIVPNLTVAVHSIQTCGEPVQINENNIDEQTN